MREGMNAVDLSLYRPHVGVVLFNPARQVWIGRRPDPPEPWNCQFPQGGGHHGADLEAAARRGLLLGRGRRRLRPRGRPTSPRRPRW